MTTSMLTKPKFNKEQTVCFAGGTGTITNCRPEAGKWVYAVEMDLGTELAIFRLGNETAILLDEEELRCCNNN